MGPVKLNIAPYSGDVKKEFFVVSNKEQLSEEVNSCGFELVEDEIDPIRPEYRFSMLRYI